MASQPATQPDTIEPQSPPEAPNDPTPIEQPQSQPDEVNPVAPDFDQPGTVPDEV